MIVASNIASLHPADLDPIREGDRGYRSQQVSLCVVFGARGQFIGADEFAQPLAVQMVGQRMMLPEPIRLAEDYDAHFLWDYRPGSPGVERGASQRRERELDKFEASRAFHHRLLADVTDTPLSTFLKFQDVWSPQADLQWLGTEPGSPSALVYRFQYDDELLHERHAARLAWNRTGLCP